MRDMMINETKMENADLNKYLGTNDVDPHNVYQKLSGIDKKSTDKLNAAETKTDKSDYRKEDNTEITPQDVIPGVNAVPQNVASDDEELTKIEETADNIKDVLSTYGEITDDEVEEMLKLISEVKQGKSDKLYSRLPKIFKSMVDGLVMHSLDPSMKKNQINQIRNAGAKTLLDEFINDAKFSKAIEDYNSEMSNVMNEMGTEYSSLITEAIDKTFSKIDEIAAENPEQAKNIIAVKDAFEDALTFNKQFEIASHTSYKKISKWGDRFKDEVLYFNKRVSNNSAGVKVPDISELLEIIKIALPQYTDDDIKNFICVIIKSVYTIDVNSLAGIAYIYKMISSIYTYKFVVIDEKGEEIFKNISRVIDAIIS